MREKQREIVKKAFISIALTNYIRSSYGGSWYMSGYKGHRFPELIDKTAIDFYTYIDESQISGKKTRIIVTLDNGNKISLSGKRFKDFMRNEYYRGSNHLRRIYKDLIDF